MQAPGPNPAMETEQAVQVFTNLTDSPNPAMKPERSPQMLMNTWFNSNALSPDKGLGAFEPEAKNAPRVG